MIVGMLRVRNEARWIADVLGSIRSLCSQTVVFDDHSDDDTPEICHRTGALVLRSQFAGLDEARDKNHLLGYVMGLRPDWILHIDGDEALKAGDARIITEAVKRPAPLWYSLRVLYLWDRTDQVRTDGVYGQYRRPSLFRALPGLRFRPTTHGGNFHCGNVPRSIRGQCGNLSAALLHYGYMDRADRIRKYEWYRQQDPNSATEDHYRHLVIGDVFPPKSRFQYGGPLVLESLT